MVYLVFIPAAIFFICGYLIPQIERETLIPQGEDSGSAIVRVEGRVSIHPEMLYGNTYFDLALISSGKSNLKSGDIIGVIIKGQDPVIIQRDDILILTGELSASGGRVVIKANSRNIEHATANTLSGLVFGLRQRFYNCINMAFSHYLKSDYASLARALILGDRRGIPDRQYDMFRDSGTAHLMAISGMHISFLAAIIYMILGRICRRPILVMSITFILILYNFILGPGASVMRATIWVLGAAAAGTWKREFRPAYMLCISFMLLPLLQPSFIGKAGFWLSFSAVSGIVFIYPAIRHILIAVRFPRRALDNHLISTVIMTISIQLICGPLLLYYFGNLPLISPVSNLFILPPFYILILLLFLASAMSIIWPPLAGGVLKLASFLFKPVCSIAWFFSNTRFPSLEAETIQAGKLFVYYLMIFAVFGIIRKSIERKV